MTTMWSIKMVWATVWSSVAIAFVLNYAKHERDAAQEREKQLHKRLGNWSRWTTWRNDMIRSEHVVT